MNIVEIAMEDIVVILTDVQGEKQLLSQKGGKSENFLRQLQRFRPGSIQTLGETEGI